MRKIIAISVMLVLLGGAVFAVDLSGSVNGTVNVFYEDDDSDTIKSSASMDRIRLEGSGKDETGKFGGWIRVEAPSLDVPGKNEPFDFSNGFAGYGWWKPIDVLLFRLGSNGGDGFYAKEGVTGWDFYQTASDVGVTNPGNCWGGSYGGKEWGGAGKDGADVFYGIYRKAFYGGFGSNAAMLEITPIDMLGINIVLPFFDYSEQETKETFLHSVIQVDLKFDFGNIAVTWQGASMKEHDQPTLFAYFGGNFDALSLDVGIGYEFPDVIAKKAISKPLWMGAGVKFVSGGFGMKVRALAGLAGDDEITHIRSDVLPYFIISDSFRAYISAGLGVALHDKDTMLDLHFNPYIEIGQEWGPKFLAGLKIYTEGDRDRTLWAVPIGLEVSF
jgi:hypothetical protein